MMKHKRTIHKIGVSFLLMILMITAIALPAMAQGTVTGLVQTKAGDNTATITWNADLTASGYRIYVSSDNVTFNRYRSSKENMDVAGEAPVAEITGMTQGSSCYVKIAPVFQVAEETYTEGTMSAALEVTTLPGEIPQKSLAQTSADKNLVSLSWEKSVGADGYRVYNADQSKVLADTKTTGVQISEAEGTSNTYYVYPYRTAAGKVFEGTGVMIDAVRTTPGKPVDVASAECDNLKWNATRSNQVTVFWNRNEADEYDCDGFQVEITSVNGKKKLAVYHVGKNSLYKGFNLSSVKNKGFGVRVRGYIKLAGKKYYGTWSGRKVVIPEAAMKIKSKTSSTMTISWTKVANATKYEIYVCKDYTAAASMKEDFKKIATVKGSKTAYTVKKLKSNQYAAVYVVPVVKVGSKSYKASALWCKYVYIN